MRTSSRSHRAFVTLALCSAVLLVLRSAEAHDTPKLERLPEGMTVELVGISTHPSGKTTWWQADGTRMITAPCDPPSESVRSPGREVREIVVRIHGTPEGTTVNWSTTQSKSRKTSVTRKDGRAIEELQTVIAEFPQGASTCDLHFDLSFGDWATEQESEGAGAGIERNQRAFFFGRARETKTGTTIAVAHTVADRDVRLIAIAGDGRQLFPVSSFSGGAGHLKGIESDFDVVPSQIREYRLQSRAVGQYDIMKVVLQPLDVAK